MVSRRSIKGVSRTVLVGIAIVIIAVAGIGAYYLTRPSPTEVEQTLIVGTMDVPLNLDPAIGYYHPDIITNFLVFESLTEWIVPDCLNVEGELATEWTVSDDGLTYDFTLRQGVKFHDGTEMTAEDVEYCIERSLELGSDWTSIMGAVYLADIESVDVLDTYKVRFNLVRQNVNLPRILAFGIMASIFPKEACEEAGDEWGKTVLVGSGPFKFVEFVEGERIVFERFDDYWGGKPELEEIILLIDMDPTVGKMSLERGDIDIYYKEPLMADIPALKANPDIVWEGYPSGRVRYILFNLREDVHPALADKRVRQAIAYAVNVTRVVEVGYKGEGQVVYSMMNSIIEPYYKPVLEKYECDPQKAKDLLAEAGYPNGFEITLLYTDHYEGMDLDAAVVIADSLAEAGITCNLDFEEYGVYNEKAKTMPMLLAGWFPDFLDPDNTMMMTLHSGYGWLAGRGNYNWSNSRYDELGYLGKAEQDVEEREEIYDEAQEILADELPNYPFRECMKNIFMNKWVKDLHIYPLIWAEDESWKEAYLVPRD